MAVILWHIEVSHFNEKARWALDYKGFRYERRVPMPGLHGLSALVQTRGASGACPWWSWTAGGSATPPRSSPRWRSTRPDPPLYPADAGERARALELEDFFDEHLGPELRRFAWHHTLKDPDVVARTLFAKGDPRARAPPPRGHSRWRASSSARTTGVTEDSATRGARGGGGGDGPPRGRGRPVRLPGGRPLLGGRPRRRVPVHPGGPPPERPFLPTGDAAPAVQELSDELIGAARRTMGLRHVRAPPRRLCRGGPCTSASDTTTAVTCRSFAATRSA